MIIRTERILLVLLDFKMNFPTAMDFAQFFLYLSDARFDFSEIINDSLSFIYVSLMGKIRNSKIYSSFFILNIYLTFAYRL